MEKPKISVLVITYNQENVISKALDSLLSQKEFIYEICISDDCSSDKTWDIINDYDRKNPGIFVLNRNEPNIGIFENVEKTWTMPKGDIIYQLSGDDECGDGWFQKVITFIQENKIDYKSELFCIYGDYKAIYPNGDSYIMQNKEILSGVDPIRLTLRAFIGNRSLCFSKKVLDKFEKVSQGRSYIAESAQDKQIQLFSERNYYIPYVGNVYYAGIGVSSRFNEKKLKDREQIETYARKFIEGHNYKFSQKDLTFIKFLEGVAILYRNKSILFKMKLFWLYLKSIDPMFGLKGLRIKRKLFAIARRIPHNKPLEWYL